MKATTSIEHLIGAVCRDDESARRLMDVRPTLPPSGGVGMMRAR
jgi:hypothetical protein